MIWLMMLGVIYLAAVSLLLLFLAGASRAKERWDCSNDALWQARYDYDEERLALPPAARPLVSETSLRTS